MNFTPYTISGLLIFIFGCNGVSKHDGKVCNEMMSPHNPSCQSVMDTGELFISFVKNFNVADYDNKPYALVRLIVLPDDVYTSALALKAKNYEMYIETVCQYLLKYHSYYINTFHQSYDLVDYGCFESTPEYVRIKGEGNDAMFIMREFVEFSGTPLGGDPKTFSNYIGDWYYETYLKRGTGRGRISTFDKRRD